MTYKGIVFDKDGTLIDFYKTWLPVYRHAALDFAQEDEALAQQLLDRHGYDSRSGRFIGGSLLAAGNNSQIAKAWTQQLARIADEAELEAVSQHLNLVFQQQGAINSTPVPNLQPTLRRLRQSGLKLGVATSDSFQGIHDTLQAFDVLGEFEFLCGYDSGHGVKPGPGMVLAFCEALALEPGEVIVVGDNSHDIEMGRNAGAGLCVGVLTGASTRDQLDPIADRVFDDISGLLDLFDR